MATETRSVVNFPRKRGRKYVTTRKKYDSQKKWQAEYQKEKSKQIGLRFYSGNMDVYEHIKSHENINGYIIGLVRADMEKQQ